MATGVAKVESTANSAPASWAMSATALRSVSRMIGLAGVSAHTSAVGHVERRPQRRQIRGVDQRHVDAHAGQRVADQLGGARVGDVARHQAIACRQPPQQQRRDRRHARCVGAAVLGSFQRRQLRLELPHRGVAPPGVDERLLSFVPVHRRERHRLVDDVRGRHHQVRGGGVGGGIGDLAGVDGGGAQADPFGEMWAHGARLLPLRAGRDPCCQLSAEWCAPRPKSPLALAAPAERPPPGVLPWPGGL